MLKGIRDRFSNFKAAALFIIDRRVETSSDEEEEKVSELENNDSEDQIPDILEPIEEVVNDSQRREQEPHADSDLPRNDKHLSEESSGSKLEERKEVKGRDVKDS